MIADIVFDLYWFVSFGNFCQYPRYIFAHL